MQKSVNIFMGINLTIIALKKEFICILFNIKTKMEKLILLIIICSAYVHSSEAQSEQLRSQKLNILTIGDFPTGTFEYSWPQQLKKLLSQSVVINKSISGNTIGFDNLGRDELNTLRNINRYLEEASNELGPQNNFDYLL